MRAAKHSLSLSTLSDSLAVVRLAPGTPVPGWVLAVGGAFSSVTRTADELSIVCAESAVPLGEARVEGGWRALKVAGPLDFGLTGVLASLASPLAAAGVSIFAVSTFDTDYVLVRGEKLDAARTVLERAGHRFEG
ncbi:MAG: ACT domain-containing protein [Deltaproteobacteria bacterium]|nr:ACT domain-containing protein [Deltaproteobacteria bacterium]